MRRSEATIREYAMRLSSLGAAAGVRVVAGTGSAAAQALLVDRAARAHELGAQAVIGRDPEQVDLVVHHDSVSRRHAELGRDPRDGRWRVRDLDSTNGTFVDGKRVVGPTEIDDGQVISLGHVPLAFLALPRPARRGGAAERTEPLATPLVLVPRRGGGGGGEAQLGPARVSLDAESFALACVLASRWLAEAERDPGVRGYVRTMELAGALGRATDELEVRKLARRLSRRLGELGAGPDGLESCDRLGFRLRWPAAVVPA